jgi:prolyl-tRNA editing enzyme YbaK/EbsC (Cys-tRNA(Pro) deacylase)
VLAMVPGDRRVDLDKVARAAEAVNARIARAPEVEEATGFSPGAVAPFPLPGVDRVLIDRNLLGYDVVWIGAGSPQHIAALAPTALVQLAKAQPMDAVQDPTYDAGARGDA